MFKMNFFFGKELDKRSIFKYHKRYIEDNDYIARNVILERVLSLLKKEATISMGFNFQTLLALEFSTFEDIEKTIDRIEEEKNKVKSRMKNPSGELDLDIAMKHMY